MSSGESASSSAPSSSASTCSTSSPHDAPSSSSSSSYSSSSSGSTGGTNSSAGTASTEELPSSVTDTVPTNNSGSPPDDPPSLSNVWGVLYPGLDVCKLYKVISLDYEGDFIVGRDPSCHYKITLSDGFGESKELTQFFSNISKKHFNIFRVKDESEDGFSVKLKDMSFNGTFVNRTLVGRGKTVTLSNCSTIGLARKDQDAFVFVNTKDLAREQQQLPKDFKRKYRLERWRLGGGAMGIVRRGCLIETEEYVAVKLIERKETSQFSQDIAYEANLMRRLKHPHIINIHDVYETPEMMYIVLEFAQGGDLCEYIIKNGAIQQNLVEKHFYDLLNALQYLHTQRCVHRDIKPENILLTSKDISTCSMKITDFGLSRLVAEASVMSTVCGTPMYAAPEIFTAKTVGYTEKIDVWSMGCVLYNMLSANMPFPRDDVHAIKRGVFKFHTQIWSSISQHFKDLISGMLKVNVEERFAVEDAIKFLKQDEDVHGVKRELSGGSSEEETAKRMCGN